MMKMLLKLVLNILLRPQKDSDLTLENLALCRQLAIWKRHKKRPQIYGELLKLGIKISERTVSNLMPFMGRLLKFCI
jgi:hypothetical protein